MPGLARRLLMPMACCLVMLPVQAQSPEQEPEPKREQEQEHLDFSYARLYDLKYQFVALPAGSTTHLRFHLRLQPRQQTGAEKLPPLAAYVDWPRQRIDLDTNQSLNLLGIPLSPQLRQENPRVITNWPKDSAALGLAMEIAAPEGTSIDRAALLTGLKQANAAIRARSRRPASLTPQAVGVTLRAMPGTQLRIMLLGEDGDEHVIISENEVIDLQEADLESAAAIRIEGELQIVFPWFG